VVAPLHVEVGDAPDHLVVVAADQGGRAVLPLHGQRLRHLGQVVLPPLFQRGIRPEVRAAERRARPGRR